MSDRTKVAALTAALDRLEAEREERRRVAAAFWAAVPADLRPAADQILATIEGVATELAQGPLADAELAARLATCIPPRGRP